MATRNPPPQGERPGPEVVSETRLTALDLVPGAPLPSPAPGFLGLFFCDGPFEHPSDLYSPSPLGGTQAKSDPHPQHSPPPALPSPVAPHFHLQTRFSVLTLK